MFMASKENQIENIKFIDALCRLGVSYHFEHEILEQLETMFGSHDFMQMIRDNELDLYTVALVFQVFRQFGYKLVAGKLKNWKQYRSHPCSIRIIKTINFYYYYY